MKNIVFDKIKNNEVKIVVNLTIVLIYLYSLLGFIFEYLPTIFESIYYLLLDVLLLICSIIALKNTRNNKLKIFLVFFLTYLLFTYIINLNKLSFFMFLNGVRELIPLLIPIIILQIFKSNQRNVFINKLNRFLHVYLILQIPVSITQFLEHGAGDAVGGTLGTGFSGVMTLISRALKSPFSYYIIVDLVKHSFYQVNNLYFKFEPKR